MPICQITFVKFIFIIIGQTIIIIFYCRINNLFLHVMFYEQLYTIYSNIKETVILSTTKINIHTHTANNSIIIKYGST